MSASPSAEGQASEVQPVVPAGGDLFKDIFGGEGSDVSDLSDDEDEVRRRPRRASPGEDDDDEAAGADGDDADEEEEEGEAYVPATTTTSARIPKFRKRRGDDNDEDEDAGANDEDDSRRKRKKKTKERRKERRPVVDEDEEDEPVLDEATRRRLALEERIENIGKKARVPRRKKKGGEDVDIVDSYHDEICIRLRDRMLSAAAKDINANSQKLPATSKLAMLDEVVGVLQNTTLWSSIIDNEVLKAVKQWLEPLPDRSLPAVGIQKAVFEVLPKMDLDTPTIREAQLGPIILFYTKTKRVTPAINRQAEALIQVWSRPIIKRPADFRSRFIASADDVLAGSLPDGDEDEGDLDGDDRVKKEATRSGAKPKRFDVRLALQENATRRGARPPVANEIQYTVAPESRLQHHVEDLQHVSRIQMDNRKFNRFARQMKGGVTGRR